MSNETIEQRSTGLGRLCPLCGEPMGKHIAPPYGTRLDEVGAMGLYCPTDPRVKEFMPHG